MPEPALVPRRVAPWYLAAVVVGAVLFVVAAIRQPFSYDELTQIRPYATGSLDQIIHATRQPPLGPLVDAFIERLLGQGQLRQRLLPVLSGVGSLTLMSLLLRRLGLGRLGALAVLAMATAPLMVRYSAYTRPYCFPAFVMLLTAYAAQRWIDGRNARWLVVAAVGTLCLPLIRVPEPVAFLGTSVVTLGVFWWRKRFTRQQALPLIVVQVGGLLTTGLWSYRSLEQSSGTVADLRPDSLANRFGSGLHELVTHFPQTLAAAFPWWPLTVLVLVLVLAIGPARRRLFGWWLFWPLLAGPVAFTLAYHFAGKIPFEALPYRSRYASFFIAPLTLATAALLASVERDRLRLPVRVLAVLAPVALLLSALPHTYGVLARDASPDFQAISQVLTTRVPRDAIVLYDRPTPAGASRQPFLGTYRYMGSTPFTDTVAYIPDHPDDLPTSGPVYLLFNGQCAYPGRCSPGSKHAVTVAIRGWHIVYQHERFTLYAPTGTANGRVGVIRAMEASAQALGPNLGYVQTYAAAAVLLDQGREAAAHRLVDDLRASVTAGELSRMQDEIDLYHLDPFTTTDHR